MKHIAPEYYGYTQAELASQFRTTGAELFIDEHRAVDQDGQLDVDATAISLSATVERHKGMQASGQLKARTDGWTILLADDLSAKQEPFVVGHEIGHIQLYSTVALRAIALGSYHDKLQRDRRFHLFMEAYCDYFAGKLLGVTYPATVPEIHHISLESRGQLTLFETNCIYRAAELTTS